MGDEVLLARPRRRRAPLARWTPFFPGLLLVVLLALALAGCSPVELPVNAAQAPATLAAPSITEQAPAPTPAPPPPGPAAPSGPSLAIAPQTGTTGTLVTATGTGWRPGEAVSLNVFDPRSPQAPLATYPLVITNQTGSFTVTFAIPSDAAWVSLPAVLLSASATLAPEETSPQAPFILVAGPGTPEAGPTAIPTSTPYTTPTPTPYETPTPTPYQTPAPGAIVPGAPNCTLATVTTAGLNVRGGPGTDYVILAGLRWGDSVTVLGQDSSGYWLNVRLYDGTEGWVDRSLTDFGWDCRLVVIAAPLPIYPTAAPLPVYPTAIPIPVYPTAAPQPGPVPYGYWLGQYYANPGLYDSPTVVRYDSAIDFNWGYGAPAYGIPAQYWSASWTGAWYFNSATYRFHAYVDDGTQVYVDGNLVINDWRDGSPREDTGDIWLGAGQHTVVVYYYQAMGTALIHVWWEQLYAPSPSYPDWKGEYYDNQDLSGSPTFVRNDGSVDFDWGTDGPGGGIGGDDFSVRWTRSQDFDDSWYRFNARADDGIRVWVDSALIIDEWHDSAGNRVYTNQVRIGGGSHRVKVEYYQNGGGALVDVWWYTISSPATATSTFTPTPTFTATPTPTLTPSITPTPSRTPTPTNTFTPELTSSAPTHTPGAPPSAPTAILPTEVPPPQAPAPAAPVALPTARPTAAAAATVVPVATTLPPERPPAGPAPGESKPTATQAPVLLLPTAAPARPAQRRPTAAPIIVEPPPERAAPAAPTPTPTLAPARVFPPTVVLVEPGAAPVKTAAPAVQPAATQAPAKIKPPAAKPAARPTQIVAPPQEPAPAKIKPPAAKPTAEPAQIVAPPQEPAPVKIKPPAAKPTAKPAQIVAPTATPAPVKVAPPVVKPPAEIEPPARAAAPTATRAAVKNKAPAVQPPAERAKPVAPPAERAAPKSKPPAPAAPAPAAPPPERRRAAPQAPQLPAPGPTVTATLTAVPGTMLELPPGAALGGGTPGWAGRVRQALAAALYRLEADLVRFTRG